MHKFCACYPITSIPSLSDSFQDVPGSLAIEYLTLCRFDWLDWNEGIFVFMNKNFQTKYNFDCVLGPDNKQTLLEKTQGQVLVYDLRNMTGVKCKVL